MNTLPLREIGIFAVIGAVIATVFRIQGASVQSALIGGIVGFAAGLLVWRLIGVEMD